MSKAARLAARSSWGRRLHRAAAVAIPFVVCLTVLGGCGVVRDETAGSLLVTPRKYRFYNCPLLAGTLTGTRQRIVEFERLIARASQGPGGAAIASVSYRSEYLQARGEEQELMAEFKEKNCGSESTWTSDRTVY